jgi:hypothetical protein
MLSHLNSRVLHHFTFYPKSDKPIEAVIPHLPMIICFEDIALALQELGFDVNNLKEMTAKRLFPEGSVTTLTLLLFLVTLACCQKSQTIFTLTDLRNIGIKIETYRAQTGLTQC